MANTRISFTWGLAILVLPLIPSLARAELPKNSSIQMCEDSEEWPPFTYRKRENGTPTNTVTGFTVDVLTQILHKQKVSFKIDFLPFTRCTAEVKAGKKYQLITNASYNEERARDYLMTRPVYLTSSYYFYSRIHHPKGLTINTLADLKKYRVCGIHGYNYKTYGLDADEIDQSETTFKSLAKRLQINSCDLFIEKKEIMAGFAVIGEPNYLEDKRLGYAPVPNVPPTPFYMLISRHYRYGQDLLEVLDTGLEEMERSGQLKKLLQQYVR